MLTIRKYLIPLFLDCLAITVFAQVQGSHFFHTLKQTDGLSGGWNAYLHKDSHDFLWISSVDGLNRFDGLNVKVYKSNDEKPNQIKGNNIQSDFFEDSNQNLWFSTYDYINCYRRNTDDFEAFRVVDSKKELIKSGYRVFYLGNNNDLWVKIGELLFVFDINSKTYEQKNIFLPHRYVQFLNEGKKRNLLLAYDKTAGFDIIEIHPNNQFVKESYFHKGKWACNVNDIFTLNETDFIVATNIGLLHFDKNNPYVPPHIDTVFQDFSLKNIVSLSKVPNSKELLVTTFDQGIFIYNLEQKSFIKRITASNETSEKLMFKKIWRTYVDSSAHLWIATVGEGIRHTSLLKSKFSAIPIASNGNSLSANCSNFIEVNKNQVLAIAENCIVSYKNKKLEKTLKILENQQVIHINYINKDKLGNIWVAANTGLYQLVENQGKFLKIGIHSRLSYLYQLDNGHLLCGGKGGIFEVSISNPNQIEHFQNIVDTTKEYSTIYQDHDGVVFISKNYESVLVYKKKDSGFIFWQELSIAGTISGFYEDTDNINLWIGTSNGLVKLNKKTLEYKTLTEQHGLPNQYICGLLGDVQNNIWLSTNKGLVRYSPAANTFRHYLLADGLLSEEGIDMSFMKTSDDIFWLGSSGGINIFNLEDIKDLAVKPKVQLISLKINDVLNSQYNITETQELTLPYSQNTISFNFVALEFSDPNNNLLKYRLKNHDDRWLTVKNTEGAVRYPNLPAGTYYLQIKAANSDGVWNEDRIRELKITILTPWHQAWWFYLLCFLTISAIIGYIVYLRLSKIFDLQELRIKLHENLHDDLGSRLTAIVMMIQTRPLNDKAEDTKTLDEIKTIASSIVANMRHLVWATDEDNDALSNVVQQMHTDKETLLPKVVLSINTDKNLQNFKIDGNKRYQMLSIYDEALTNINKYAEASVVTVTLKSDGTTFMMTINDNGIGLPDKPNEDSNMSGKQGFRNMHNRAKRINGNLTITSTKVVGEGTTIFLEFPLHQTSFFQRLRSFFSKSSPK